MFGSVLDTCEARCSVGKGDPWWWDGVLEGLGTGIWDKPGFNAITSVYVVLAKGLLYSFCIVVNLK